MITEQDRPADVRAEQLRRMLAEKDARMQQLRHRTLPAWLARRGNRRAVALLPVVPLACGIYAGTLPDTVLRSALMASVAAVCVIGILLLRRVTRLLDAVPDRLLDEREIDERNRAYRRAHALVVGLLGLLAVLAVTDGTWRKVTGTALMSGDGWLPVTMTAMLVAGMIPAAVVAWRWEEPADDPDA